MKILCFLSILICGVTPFVSAAEELLAAPTGSMRVSAGYIPGLTPGENEEVILDVYTVKKGDWLRTIARREYGNSELWRIIYDYNDFINDSHWIFPGDELILPRVVQKQPEPVETAPQEHKEEAPAPDRKVFIAPPDFEFDGAVAGFKENNLLQAQGAYCFINIGSASGLSEGSILNIYELRRPAVNPDTGRLMGEVYAILGQLRVTSDISEASATARIVYSHKSVEEGSPLLISSGN